MIEFVPYPLLVGILLMIILQAVLWRRNLSPAAIFCFSVFWVYLLFVISMILFPMPIPGRSGGLSSSRQALLILSRINFIPFDFGQFRHLDPGFVFMREILDNILLTLPFGFGICWIIPIPAKKIPWLALAVGLGTETAQLVMCLVLGSLYRGIDINDTILNALGVYLGYLLFRLFSWWVVGRIHRFKIKPVGILAYLYTQAARVQAGGGSDAPREAGSS